MHVGSTLTIGILAMLCVASFVNLWDTHAQSPCSASQSAAWQICGPIESSSSLNLQPTVAQALDGSLSMAWTGYVNPNYVIMYATGVWTGSSWSWTPGSNITPLGGKNQDPAIVQLSNTTEYVIWAYKPKGSPNYQLYYVKQNVGSFSRTYARVPMTSPTTLNDTLPTASVGKDGTLWLVWTRDNTTALGTGSVMRQLWYKTLKEGVWSTEQPLTPANYPGWNFQPSVMVGKDNLVRVAFSRTQFPSGVSDIYDMTYNGSVWTTSQITTQTTKQDSTPSIMQDRNGTLWVFWVRNDTSYAVYSKYSTTVGSSWTSDTALTATVDSEYPAAVQSTADRNIWVFYSTNIISSFNIYALETVTPVAPVHDVAIVPFTYIPVPSFILTNVSMLYPGGLHVPYGWVNGRYSPIDQSALVQVTVKVQNEGDFTETVTLSLASTNTTSSIFKTSVFQLAAGTIVSEIFNWNTTGLKPARYGISANASIPIVTVGNKPDGLIYAPNLVHLLPLGDVDQDGSVTITDVTVIFTSYNYSCFSSTTCSPQFMAAQWGDVDGSAIIDIIDAAVVAQDFNTVT